jgi:hypothetical protein
MIPFSGLSLIIHFIIIIIRKVYEKLDFRFSFNFLKKEAISYLIVFFIFGFVITSAFFLIRASIRNSPNLQVVEDSFSSKEAIAESSSNNDLPVKNDYPTVISLKTGIESLVSSVAILAVDFLTSPSSGSVLLNNVDFTAYVSGNATGDITYRFDCTNDGSWERTITTSSTSYTATDLCSYSSTGTYTAKVRVERDGVYVEGTAKILVTLQ